MSRKKNPRRSRNKNKIRFSKKAGLAPGTLVYLGEKKTDQVTLNLIDYDANNIDFLDVKNFQDCKNKMTDLKTVTWLNINGLHDIELINQVGTHFHLHTLTLEDILNIEHRPKLEEHEKYLYVTMKMFEYTEETDEVSTEQISFILSPSTLISFQEYQGDVLDPVRQRLSESKGKVRFKSADYLLYALMDVIVDRYFFVMEALGDKIEKLEENVLDDPTPETLEQIQHLRKQLREIRKSVFPLREGIGSIIRGETTFIDPNIYKYYRDLYDHTISVIETVETYREQLSSVKDLYLSSLSNKMNNIMKVLTIMASIFIPLTFVAGIYGMNFDVIPELKWEFGYVYFWSVIVVITVLMIWYFKRKDWL